MGRSERGKNEGKRRKADHQWTDDELALLGKISDSEMARRLGVWKATVHRKRRALGIPPAGGEHTFLDWTPDKIALLGTMSDSRVAAQLGIANSTVAQRRRLLGIPARRPRRMVDWTLEKETLLGTMPDGELAVRLGATVTAVGQRRRLQGIPAWIAPQQKRRGNPRHHWTADEVALLGQIPDSELARQLGLAHNTVKHEREARGIPIRPGWGRKLSVWTPEREALLGTTTDAALARQLGLAQTTVNHRRQQLGIPAFKQHRTHSSLLAVDGAKVKALREALGKSKRALAGGNNSLAAHLGTIESGQVRSVRPAMLNKICALLDCKPAAILRAKEH